MPLLNSSLPVTATRLKQTKPRPASAQNRHAPTAGEEQALKLGHHLKSANRIPDFIYIRPAYAAPLILPDWPVLPWNARSIRTTGFPGMKLTTAWTKTNRKTKVIDRLGETTKIGTKTGSCPAGRPPTRKYCWTGKTFWKLRKQPQRPNGYDGHQQRHCRFALAHTENGRDFP